MTQYSANLNSLLDEKVSDLFDLKQRDKHLLKFLS